MKYHRGELVNEQSKNVDFGLRDSKGRSMGARVDEFETVFTPAPENTHSWYNLKEAGYYYGLNAQASRNGKRYGASQQTKYFKTKIGRAEALAKYLAEAGKRAKKMAK